MYTLLTWQIYVAVPIIFKERQLGGVFTTMYRYVSKAMQVHWIMYVMDSYAA